MREDTSNKDQTHGYSKFLAHKRGDMVAVAVDDVVSGVVEVTFIDTGTTISLVSSEAIPLGHKIALGDVSQGDVLIEYGMPIGIAVQAIASGTHVHTHNLRSARWTSGH